MRTVSAGFLAAQAQDIQIPWVRVVARPPAEAPQWVVGYGAATGPWGLTNTPYGPTRVGGHGQAAVTFTGTLVRTMTWGGSVLRQTTGEFGNPELSSWSSIGSSGVNNREALSVDGDQYRVFWANGASIQYAGTAGGGSISIPPPWGTGSWADTALTSPHPDIVFACQRVTTVPLFPDDVVTYGLKICAFQNINGGWVATPMPRQPMPTRDIESQAWLLNAAFSFCSAISDAESNTMVVCYLDDLSGRPAVSEYRNRQWSFPYSLEGIDFTEPERDAIWGMQCSNFDNKIVLSAWRQLGDSDFVTNRQGVLYYSFNGKAWSDAYFVGESNFFNYGTPVLWQNQFCMVGPSNVLVAAQSDLFGSTMVKDEIDITRSLVEASIDESEGFYTSNSCKISLTSDARQWLNHKYMQQGYEVAVDGSFYNDAGVLADPVRLFSGSIERAEPRVGRADNNFEIDAQDFIANLKRGQLDRVLAYPQAYKTVTKFDEAIDLERVATTTGEWDHYKTATYRALRAHKKFRSEFRIGTGITTGDISVSARFMITNPEVGVTTGVNNTHVPELKLMWNIPADHPYQGYEIRCGNFYGEGFHFYKYREIVETDAAGQPTGVFNYIEDVLGANATPLPINQWFRLTVHQNLHTIIVSLTNEDETITTELFRYTDTDPHYGSGIIAVHTKIPYDPPANLAEPFHTILVDEILAYNHEPEYSTEEYLSALISQRGFDGLVAEQWYDGPPGALGINTQNLLVDIDAGVSEGSTVILNCRAGATNTAALTLTVEGVAPEYRAILSITTTGAITTTRRQVGLVPVYPGADISVRMVASNEWFACYVGNSLVGMFWIDMKVDAGTWQVGGTANIHHVKVPRLNLGSFPLVKPGETLDKHLQSILEANHAWVVADGRTMKAGVTHPQFPQATVTQDRWLSSGFELNTEEAWTHIRVVSEDEEGNQVSGTVYSPDLWRKFGRTIMKIEQLDGLRTAKECRDAAWDILVQREEARSTRNYDVHPQLTWERFDYLQVINPLDDTNTGLDIAGIQRNFTRDPRTEALSVGMQVLLHERNLEVLTRSTEYPAED